MLGILDRAIRQAGDSPDRAFKFVLGYVVRTEQDAHISRARTVSVITEDGVYYHEVLLTSASRFYQEFPHTPENADIWGSRVVVGFIDNSVNKPFIVCYLPDTEQASPDLPMNYSAYSNNSLKFIYDGFGHTSIVFDSGEDMLEVQLAGEDSIAHLTFEGTLEVYANNFDFQSMSTSIMVKSLEENFEEHKYVVKQLEEEVTEKEKSKIQELEQEIQKAKLKIENLEAELKSCKINSDKFSLASKNINLSSESPKDAPVLFNELNKILTKLLTALQSLTVTCTSPGSPSSPPMNLSQFAQLQAQLMNMKSKYIKIE